MKLTCTLLLLAFAFAAYGQTPAPGVDTLIVDGKTVTGKLNRIYADRVFFTTGTGTQYMIQTTRINAMNVRSKTVINGMVGIEYVSDIARLKTPGLPDYKDQQFYLRQAGTQGIAGISCVFAGSLIYGIASLINNQPMQTAGGVFAAAGISLALPVSIFLLKAGKVKQAKEF
jgi:hypothetical protein